MIALQTSGIEVGSITVLLGALGVGIGFGLQNVVSNFVSGVVPNGDLVANPIINWSHGDPKVRFRLPVGVAYGSDMARVQAALIDVAAAHPDVLTDPPPTVFLSGFGDSSLDLELVVWTRSMVTAPLEFRSELNFAIDAAFRRHGVLIPFPQRDVHLIPGPEPLPSPA
jgi:small-conductance mechanosensitive channel